MHTRSNVVQNKQSEWLTFLIYEELVDGLDTKRIFGKHY